MKTDCIESIYDNMKRIQLDFLGQMLNDNFQKNVKIATKTDVCV